MADRLNVAERLAEGRPAVADTQSYVRACQALGYTHPDLTSRPSQVLDRYADEDGLDLRALDRDYGRLRAAASALTDAWRMQQAQVASLAAAWTGRGGDAAVGFLTRHCDAGATVATEVGAAAQGCESLRDNLWSLVDSKVAVTISVNERARPRSGVWLAAAAAVTTGAGDRTIAEEVVRHEIVPYVDEEIRNEWLTAMRSTLAGVAASYDMVLDRMAAAPVPTFEFPGDLRPESELPAEPGAPTWATGVTPAAASSAAAATPVRPPAAPDEAPVLAPASATAPAPASAVRAQAEPVRETVLGDAADATPGPVSAGTASPGGVGGLGGLADLAGRIVDTMGNLFGLPADEVDGGDGLDEDPFDAPWRPDEVDAADDTAGADGNDDGDPAAEARPAAASPPLTEALPGDGPPRNDATAPPAAAAPVAAAAPPPAAIPSVDEPAPAVQEGSTPCEIAADQLPQAGR